MHFPFIAIIAALQIPAVFSKLQKLHLIVTAYTCQRRFKYPILNYKNLL